ncbi:hypothetical protein ACSDR0_47315 [Streptosporangium sp. G11]|uniref:hypothetical protein n=1 Tax=Streptosporangium sp. G11 TaxID=3436926 RepID=UPI003EBAECC1
MAIACEFCEEFNKPGSWRTMKRARDYVLTPGLGSFVVGYALLIPLTHVTSMASLGREKLSEMAGEIEEIRSLISTQTGSAVLIAEHGSGACEVGASCVDHAHIHFLPTPDANEAMHRFLAVDGKATKLAQFYDLASTDMESYVYLSTTSDTHLIWPSDRFARQFVRRVVATQHQLGAVYDWREFPFTENMRATHKQLLNKMSSAG